MLKNFIIVILIIIILAGLGYYWFHMGNANPSLEDLTPLVVETPIPTDTPFQIQFYSTPTPAPTMPAWYYVEPTVDPYWIPIPGVQEQFHLG